MALVIEDGSEVTNADSYTTDAEFVAYAALRGYTIPATEALRDVLQIKAMDYLASLEESFKGYRVSSTQSLSYPRANVSLYGYLLASDSIPKELKNAQMELAYQANTNELLISESSGSSSGGALTSFSVDGVYSETYATGTSVGTTVSFGKADAYLGKLLNSTNRLVRA